MIAKLTGKVALITGAAAGIGKACARALAKEGARLVLTGRRRDRLEELKQEAQKLGTQAICVAGDAREESTATKTVEAAIQAFGQIDVADAVLLACKQSPRSRIIEIQMRTMAEPLA